jgi:hypothetical protein
MAYLFHEECNQKRQVLKTGVCETEISKAKTDMLSNIVLLDVIDHM